jgi:uncharacterized repeat protein (TIGR01451 family)
MGGPFVHFARRAAGPLIALLLSSPGAAWAAPRLELTLEQLREVPDGAAIKRVPAKDVHPGDVVQYVLRYVNRGDEVARDAVIGDPIPPGTTYLAGTASGEGAEITFSSDGGKTFASAVRLTYEIKTPGGAVEKRVATPGDYTHIRWTLKRVEPGGGGAVSFKVRVN